MKKCDSCGKIYDPSKEATIFNSEKQNRYIHYALLNGNFCADCASQAIKNGKHGIYRYSCSSCPRKCDYGVEFDKLNDFYNKYPIIRLELTEFWNVGCLCAECAVKRLP